MALAPTLRVGDLPRPQPNSRLILFINVSIGVFVLLCSSETPIDTARLCHVYNLHGKIPIGPRRRLDGGKHSEESNDVPEHRKNLEKNQLERWKARMDGET